jgi:hypothetical protein
VAGAGQKSQASGRRDVSPRGLAISPVPLSAALQGPRGRERHRSRQPGIRRRAGADAPYCQLGSLQIHRGQGPAAAVQSVLATGADGKGRNPPAIYSGYSKPSVAAARSSTQPRSIARAVQGVPGAQGRSSEPPIGSTRTCTGITARHTASRSSDGGKASPLGDAISVSHGRDWTFGRMG